MYVFRAFAAYWRMSGQFLIVSIFFLALGFGREVSKAQRVRRVRPQDALFYGVLCACVRVLLCCSFQDGRWLGVPGSGC